MAFVSSKSINGVDEIVFNDTPNARLRYKLNGNPVVGVTTAIKAGYPTSEALVNWKSHKAAEFSYDKLIEVSTHEGNFIKWPDREEKELIIKESRLAWKKEAEEAAGIGVVVHLYAELSSKDKRDEAVQSLTNYKDSIHWNEIINACYKVDDFMKQNNDEILATESIVGSTKYLFAGRFDRLVKRNGKIIISDYKTSKNFYIDQFIQDALYSIAIEEWLGIKVDEFEVIRFGKEGGEYQQLLISDNKEIEGLKEQALRCLNTYQFSKSWEKDSRFSYR